MMFVAPEFAGLPQPARQALAGAMLIRSYGNNDFVYYQDDDATALHFVRTGHIRLSQILEDGSAILFSILPPGEAFGELGVFERGMHCDMATSVGKCTVGSVPLATFHRLAATHPEIEAALGRLVARRYRYYIDLTRNLSLRSLSARLAQSLLRLADGLGSMVQYQGRRCQTIGSVVNQTDLGLMARGARGNVNRALRGWEKAGWIALESRSIVILDRDRLERIALQETDL